MRTFHLLTLTVAAFLAQTRITPAGAVFNDLKIVEQGPHHRVWQYTIPPAQAGDNPVAHKYTELKTGLNRWNADLNQWQETDDEVELFQNGAVARKAQHQVIFSPNLNDNKGSIVLQTPDAKILKSRLIGLALTDVKAGKSLFIAEAKNSVGQKSAKNQIVYPNAFDFLKADVRYTIKVDSFEQEVLLQEQLPNPKDLGLDPDTTQVEIWTLFLQALSACAKINSDLFSGEVCNSTAAALGVGVAPEWPFGHRRP